MDRRLLAILLGGAAAACLIIAAFTEHWLVNSSAQSNIGFGLRRNHECFASAGWSEYAPAEVAPRKTTWTCKSSTNADTVGNWQELSVAHGGDRLASGVFAPLGWITLIDVILAALGLLAAVGIAIARKQPQLPVAPTTVALLGIMLGLITGCVFIATKPGPVGMVGVGLSFWLFGAGCVMGIASAQLLAKVNRPPDVDLMADAMNPDDY